MSKMTIFIIVAVLAAGAIAYLVFRPKRKTVPGNYFISTQSQSAERIKQLHLDKASEDASYILDSNKLVIPAHRRHAEDEEYKADPEKDWVIDLIQINGENFKKADFNKLFDYEWRSKYSSTLYGFSPVENQWTYADAGGTPDIYSKLQVAVDVQGIYNGENPDYDPNKLNRYLIELEKRIKKYPTKLRIEHKEPIEHAIARAKDLIALYNEFNDDAIIVLQSSQPFRGIDMWDALQCVGLTWGDGDLFHWNNTKDYGHDQHFSVWTTTDPGYFLPEEISAGRMNPANLVFGFSIPRSADPKNIYDMMLNAAKYCQKRLGGQLLDKNGTPLDEQKERSHLSGLIKSMESKGIIPGSDKALSMY